MAEIGSRRATGSDWGFPVNETILLAADSLAPVAPSVETGMKACPVCRAQVFADMDTCFNCMYLFGSNPALERKAEAKALPEVIPEVIPEAVREVLSGDPPETKTAPPLEETVPEKSGSADGELLAELLVELHGFLGQFLLNRGIDLKEP